MISPALPAELKAALEQRAHGASRSEAAARAERISLTYRGGGTSTPITTEADALAYAGARMPATYAAVIACLNAMAAIRPGFAPTTLLDVGAGPGTASWAAAQAFETLQRFTLLDANPALRKLALQLAEATRLPAIDYRLGDAGKTLGDAPDAALVIASYVINELSDAARASFADALWRNTTDTLLVVEPGTPAGYQRILDLRDRLISQGARVIAPCPHETACPLTAPDWCHFVQRLPRSKLHLQLKSADVPFEDEKFSYVALTRASVPERPARVLAQPEQTKAAITAKLCTPAGQLELAVAPRRDKPAYARFRRLAWGDTLD
ncbi:small ribosomal subunit Rsm22 [Rhodopseudomonas thermotolerans]|uniref:Small ribosomal subunit Rsm22 n=2 Tax=Rhodopseudomonas TaxID=1073 RepID=A0A336JPR3_9BRAD|nr:MULTISPECIES: small ribosomal subunit Rsm22 family protein [Rhodopseudomonas]RED36143.1 small ribosomal subunit Rsm22 [Rhodopseudomonas pentothenatexigens]REG03515.1 small ribosomal subunit Rsm22 [Rhodopseudomonas thermotolerans]SSW90703.1 small ribosomal subunit Rsm22 [Rhodopseudomonas pentothenatexigens]